MFSGNGGLTLDSSHTDLSFRKPDTWPSFTPKASIRSYAFSIGDATAGPGIQLGLMTPVADEPLDWKHSIDPVHHHGSDQFRVIPGGEWNLAGRPMQAGHYAFQEAGWVYQEHPGPGGAAWMVLLMADRRGTTATLKFSKDQQTIMQVGEEYGVPLQGEAPYPHPAGSKGLAAVVTTRGPCQFGYLLGSIRDLGDGQGRGSLTGLLGDEQAGPVVHVLRHGPGEAVVPACTYPTELFLVIVAGGCRIGDREYQAGDMRIQRSDSPLPAITSGSAGLEAVLIIGDRRARPRLARPADAPAWMSDVDRLLPEVLPCPGGVGTDQRRAARRQASAS